MGHFGIKMILSYKAIKTWRIPEKLFTSHSLPKRMEIEGLPQEESYDHRQITTS